MSSTRLDKETWTSNRMMKFQRATMTNKLSQLDKFKKAARELECDDDKKTFDKRLGKLVKSPVSGDKPKK